MIAASRPRCAARPFCFFCVLRAPPRCCYDVGMTLHRVFRQVAPLPLILWVACSASQRGPGDYRIALVPSRSGQHGIFVMNSDTTGGKLLTSDVSAQLRPNSWSPDGKTIAFLTVRRQEFDLMTQYAIPNHSILYTMNSAGGDQKRLLDYPVSDFGWAPDSKQIFFVSAYENPERSDPGVLRGTKTPMAAIYVFILGTHQQKRVTGFGQGCSASWAPDGSRIAASFASGESSGIYVVTPDGRYGSRLTDSTTLDLRPAWAPDGNRIAYIAAATAAENSAAAGVFIIGADGTGRKRVSDRAAYQVAWARDGKTLLIQSTSGLELVDADGNQIARLTPGIDRPLDAAFTPDGQGIMFRSNHESDWHIYFVDLTGANLRRLTGQLTASQFCLSPLR